MTSVEVAVPLQSAAAAFVRLSLAGVTRIPVYRTSKFSVESSFEYLISRDRGMIPYFLLPSMGCKNGLRGFARERFRDFAVAGVSLEYTLPVVRQFEAFLLADFAGTAADPVALRSAGIHRNAGVGLRLLTNDFPLSVGVASGSEGWKAFSSVTLDFP
jgi:hypothetical protein